MTFAIAIKDPSRLFIFSVTIQTWKDTFTAQWRLRMHDSSILKGNWSKMINLKWKTWSYGNVPWRNWEIWEWFTRLECLRWSRSQKFSASHMELIRGTWHNVRTSPTLLVTIKVVKSRATEAGNLFLCNCCQYGNVLLPAFFWSLRIPFSSFSFLCCSPTFIVFAIEIYFAKRRDMKR